MLDTKYWISAGGRTFTISGTGYGHPFVSEVRQCGFDGRGVPINQLIPVPNGDAIAAEIVAALEKAASAEIGDPLGTPREKSTHPSAR